MGLAELAGLKGICVIFFFVILCKILIANGLLSLDMRDSL